MCNLFLIFRIILNCKSCTTCFDNIVLNYSHQFESDLLSRIEQKIIGQITQILSERKGPLNVAPFTHTSLETGVLSLTFLFLFTTVTLPFLPVPWDSILLMKYNGATHWCMRSSRVQCSWRIWWRVFTECMRRSELQNILRVETHHHQYDVHGLNEI